MLLFILFPMFFVMLVIGLKMLGDQTFYNNTYDYKLNTERQKARYARGERYDDGWSQYLLTVLGAAGTVVTFIVILCLAGDVMQLRVIDQKIAVYEQENTRIEQSVSAMVESYVSYESDTITEVSENISPTMIFSMYPELKSNTLVEKEIAVYTENQKELRALKILRFDYELEKWWLWFG